MEKKQKNPGVLKMIQDCPKYKKKAQDINMRKGLNRNVTHNNPNKNYNIKQVAITEFHSYQPDDNIIPAQVQIPRMVRQVGVN